MQEEEWGRGGREAVPQLPREEPPEPRWLPFGRKV